MAVSGLDLHIEQGSVFGLLGPNGAGKTTTLRMIMHILAPDEGSIRILGQPSSERTQDLIGYLPEERGLYNRMKVREVLVFLVALKGLSEAEATVRVHKWLERLGLGWLAFGCIVIGVLPGLGGPNGVAILLPLTFTMDPTSAIVMRPAVAIMGLKLRAVRR